jgi:hypothetical protein
MACTDKPKDSGINREELVQRHNIRFETIDSTEIPQVGNGEIAFGIDVTGLQTLYGNTLSQWGWHSSALPEGKKVDDFKMTPIEVHDHTATYPVDNEGQEELFWWLRKNPHRLNLGKLSFLIDGNVIGTEDLSQINQKLNLWQGIIYSDYTLQGVPVKVITLCHPEMDAIAVRMESPLISEKRLSVQIAFPYGHPTNLSGSDWDAFNKHDTRFSGSEANATFYRSLDKDTYEVQLNWENNGTLKETARHTYSLVPLGDSNTFSFACHFHQRKIMIQPKISGKPWRRLQRTGNNFGKPVVQLTYLEVKILAGKNLKEGSSYHNTYLLLTKQEAYHPKKVDCC